MKVNMYLSQRLRLFKIDYPSLRIKVKKIQMKITNVNVLFVISS